MEVTTEESPCTSMAAVEAMAYALDDDAPSGKEQRVPFSA